MRFVRRDNGSYNNFKMTNQSAGAQRAEAINCSDKK
jgi:hypothetical protein